jgi:bifunctional UDP-N-acetylglucosamine pyrophosphorylase/glucosamine-1-phosphate N-acetyltransferase
MLNIVILAAGQGKRMQSNLPKVLHPIAGRPMLTHVLDSARALGAQCIAIVVGHGAEQVKQAYAVQPDLQFALQQPQLGTGHAVLQAVPLLQESDTNDVTVILYGDVPLVQPDTLRALLMARANGVAILTEILPDATGYGRIVRDSKGNVTAIVEHKDATPEQRSIQEVNTGIMAVPTRHLKSWLAKLTNNNAQGEYYLTDIIGMAVAEGVPVNVAHPTASFETLGVNSRLQQAELERLWQRELARRQLEAFARRVSLRSGRIH